MPRMHTSVLVFTLLASAACKVDAPLTPAPGPGSSPRPSEVGTLKAGAPTLVSPINSEILTSTTGVTLTISAATPQFKTQAFNYEFELLTDTGAPLAQGSVTGTTFAVPSTVALTIQSAYTWRARATLGGATGPWSGIARFQTPRLTTPTATSTNDAWRFWFFQLIELRGVGPTHTPQALLALDPDLKAAGVIQETNSAGQPRGRLYLPNTSPDRFARSVDLGDFGGPWRWLPRGATTCEGGSCR